MSAADPASASGQAGFAAALLDPLQPSPALLRSWNGSDIAARFAVHRNNIVCSLVDAVGEVFPVIRQLVGDAFFRAMAAEFVRLHPPRSRILAHYGGDFADFLRGFEPVATLPYLTDMARLEHARVLAYHCHDVPVATAEQARLASTLGERIAEIRFEWHPSLAVIESDFAIVSLFAAHQGIVDIGSVDPRQPETAVVVRDGFDVVVLSAPPGTAAFVAASRRGDVLAEAATEAARSAPGFDLSISLGILNRHGAIRRMDLPRSDAS